MATWTDGQRSARDQLEDIAGASNGQITVDVTAPPPEGGVAEFVVSLPTGHIERVAVGLPLRQRERFLIKVGTEFPRAIPEVYATHDRFAGFPHVQWARKLCLYQAPRQEYAATDGMFGLIDRLNLWLKAAALDELDPAGAPLHPPAVYRVSEDRIVIKANAPALGNDSWHWIGAAQLKRVHDKRVDVVGWTTLSAMRDEEPPYGAAALILRDPLPFEYPDTAQKLFDECERQHMPPTLLVDLMELFADHLSENEPLYVLIGSPGRRREAGSPLLPHFAVWRIAPEEMKALRKRLAEGDNKEAAVRAWAADTPLSWCHCHEAREELSIRRDRATPASYFKGKRVALLGCGALGGPIADAIVRAGAARLDLVDCDVVKPGVLVRQPFHDWDIGYAKSAQLKMRLGQIGMSTELNRVHLDLTYGLARKLDLSAFDILIDATASTGVSRAIEEDCARTLFAIPVITVAVSARAEYGMVTVRMPGHSVGPHSIVRRAKLDSMRDPRASLFAAAFWPDKPLPLFQPEPGCSEPTFEGSAADMGFHALGMLDIALFRLAELRPDEASADFIAKPSIARRQRDRYEPGYVAEGPLVIPEPRFDGRVIMQSPAEKEIHAVIAQARRRNGAAAETGGLIFGAIDETLKTTWVDSVTGPPPDSEASAEKFICGIKGTAQIAAERARLSGESSRFIGIWHTHPVSMPRPSVDDLDAMFRLLMLEPNPPRAVLMMIVGFAATRPQTAAYIFRRREFQDRLLVARRGHG